MIIKSHEIPKIVRGHWSTTGLVGYWPMMPYEVFGSKVFDLSENENTGTFGAGAASPSWVAGKYSSAISYDGDDYINTGVKSLPGTSLFCDSSQKFSVVVSFSFASGASGTIIAKAGATVAIRTFQIYTTGGNDLLINLRGENNSGLGDVVGDGKNHVVVVTWDGSVAKYYIDGLYKNTLNVGAAAEETGQNIIFGARTGGAGYFLTGVEDFVSIYNRDLSASEIAELFRNPFLPIEREPIELWVGATSVGAPPVGANPKGPLGHPLCGALAGPISF